MKKIIKIILTTSFILIFTISCGLKKEDKVVLKMISWRVSDTETMNALLSRYSQINPNVTIEFSGIKTMDYNTLVKSRSTTTKSPDLLFVKSYNSGMELFEEGYILDISSIKDIDKNFSALGIEAWSDKNGKKFAVPLTAVSHSVYYNKDIFERYGIYEFPKTWEEFLLVCEVLKSNGITPLANSIGDKWHLNEVLFMGLLPNFIGGSEGRIAYEEGDRNFNDENMIQALTALKDLHPYLPDDYRSMITIDSMEMFQSGNAAMIIDGSWSILDFKPVLFELGIDLIPAPKNKQTYMVFHPDQGIAISSKTKYPKEALKFLEWASSEKGIEVVNNYMSIGFFPLSKNTPKTIDNDANKFISFNNESKTDIRFAWAKFMSGKPSGYILMQDAAVSVITKEKTPEEAADILNAKIKRLK